MSDVSEKYNWRQKPGPAQDRSPSERVIQVKTSLADNQLFRSVVGKGNLSGFGLFSCLIMLGVLYENEQAWTRAEQTWTEMLESATQSQLEEIHEGLTSLVIMVQAVMK